MVRFLNRKTELARLDTITAGGLAVVYGRRRIGKTRLLVEWANARKGVYFVADQSAPDIQRRYLANALAAALPGFADVDYPDWRALFDRLARDAARAGFSGPVILDELPYLVSASPELPSVLQQWLDHGANRARLAVAIAGSSQRMMQGLALDPGAPLFGRATQLFEVQPLAAHHLRDVFHLRSPRDAIELHTAWGGVPRYWELAEQQRGDVRTQIAKLVLDPAGPLHQEPDRLLIEESPSATEVRPVLDAIGAGAHRVSEIAGRIGRPATSLSRPLERLQGMGLVEREVPFGEPPRRSRRSLYKISDPFFRLWFGVVAPHRSQLAAGNEQARRALLAVRWEGLVSAAWENLCRDRLDCLPKRHPLARLGPWGPPSRWWHKNDPEWDIVARATGTATHLIGEVKLTARPPSKAAVEKMARNLAARRPPVVRDLADGELVHALFVPAVARGTPKQVDGTVIVTAHDLGLF